MTAAMHCWTSGQASSGTVALSVEEIRRLIVEAGRMPVERDTLYRQVVRENGRWRSGEAVLAGA
ncbi:MAG: hypothetical protein HY000_05345 [Planctomycetes bacterium]|nr:hypothetical protein [Planctomycetota bacterium]